MEKFADIKYERPDLAKFKKDYLALIGKLKRAGSYEEADEAVGELEGLMNRVFKSYTVAMIRHNMNMKDEFYDGENSFFEREIPKNMMLLKKGTKAMLASPFRKQLEEKYGTLMFKNAEVQASLIKPSIIIPSITENKLSGEYSKVAAACSVEFMGEKCNFYGLLKHMQSTDREERKAAFEAWAKLYEEASPKLDEIFGKLIKVRRKIAKKLGFKSYIDYAYLTRQRYDYGPDEVARFREAVRTTVTPVCDRLYREQAERLGVDKLRFYDENLVFPDGNAVPQGTPEELTEKARLMYEEMSPETGEYFDFMTEHELFDFVTRENKHLGGYCTFLPDYKAPFIFSNFNGTSADVDVLTHEAGHAFQAYVAARAIKLSETWQAPIEICEVHSMSMEHFTYPWMDKFFGDDAPRYREAHLSAALEVIPYLTMVDEFQHRVYAKPEMTRDERYGVWHELEQVYLPWRDYDGDPFLEKGGFWMQKQHIFLYPFYYIDYALAQMGAFDFFLRMREDRERAWNDYLALCRAGGTVGYFDLLKIGNLRNPFDENTVKDISEAIEALL